MSQYAKSVVAAVAAVLIAGVTAWQTVVGGAPFRAIDTLPIATAVVGAFFTYLVPEVPELARAKTWIAGGFAVLTALSTFVSGHPADVTVLNLLVAGLGAAATAYVPNLGGAPLAPVVEAAALSAKAAAGQPVGRDDLVAWLKQLEELDPAVAAASSPPVAVSTPPIPTPVTVPPDPAPAPSGPLPIEAEALAAAQTAPLPAVAYPGEADSPAP